MAEPFVEVTHRERPVARRSRAHLTTASTRATPTPDLRASGATNIPTSKGRGSLGSSGSRARPVAIPSHCPSCSATKVTRAAPTAPLSARSCHTRSGNSSSCASVEPNAVGASARARSRIARSLSPSSERIRRMSVVTWGGSSQCRAPRRPYPTVLSIFLSASHALCRVPRALNTTHRAHSV